jgi:polyphosphate glucokinase
MEILGLDIGGTGIKGAIVDTNTGELVADRFRLLTPNPATPDAVVATTAKVVEHFDWKGPAGCGFPAAIKSGVAYTAANISKKWLGVNVAEALSDATGCAVTVLNDADAAGLAEMRFGAGRDRAGTVLILTLGTGIGTAIFVNGQLVPNMELGHIEIDGRDAELLAAEIVRKRKGLSWKKWGKQVGRYLQTIEKLIWPDLIIIGGGASKKHDKFFPHFAIQTEVVPAGMLNEAGIVGAALAAEPRTEG